MEYGQGAELLRLMGEVCAADTTQSIAAPAAGDGCPSCGGRLLVQQSEYCCEDCGQYCERTVEEQPGSDINVRQAPRLRAVGRRSGGMQSHLDRTTVSDRAAVQLNQVLMDLQTHNTAYRDSGKEPFPQNVLQRVARLYNVIQQKRVQRSQVKLGVLAALLFHVCIDEGFVRTEAECADLMRLSVRGISGGQTKLQAFAREGLLPGLDLIQDPTLAWIRTNFIKLDVKLPGARARELQTAALRVVQTAQQLCTGSMKTKALGAVMEILHRAGAPVSYERLTETCGIRKNTVLTFLQTVRSHHSRFEPLYREYGLMTYPRAL